MKSRVFQSENLKMEHRGVKTINAAFWFVNIVLAFHYSEARKPYWITQDVPNFVCTRILLDGEVERRVHDGRISAIETAVELPPSSVGNELNNVFAKEISTNGDGVPSMATPLEPGSQGLTLRQVTDGRHFIQLIYDAGWELRDCEYIRDLDAVDDFFRSFTEGLGCQQYLKYKNGSASSCCKAHDSAADRNFTLQLLPEGESLPQDLTLLTDYHALRDQCHSLHRRIRETIRQQEIRSKEALQRLKRDLFLYPGTNWCGSGSNARKFFELGYNAAADRCCRDHDHCPHTIEGFTTEYNFFNFRFHTISHCDCDERFRACLKLTSTAAGNMVGKLFFNIVQTKCFLFKKEKKCSKRSWWGKCLKRETAQTATLRDALTY